MTRRICIAGTGSYAPGHPITNDMLAKVMDTNDDWIRQRTGITQRHFAADGEGVSDLALVAAQRALEDANVDAKDIDYVLFATMTPDTYFPGSGPRLATKLGISGVAALDLRQQCCSYPYALQVANALVAAGEANTILVAAADAHAGTLPFDDECWRVLRGESNAPVSNEAYQRATKHRGVAVIFGDGASAMVLRATKSNDASSNQVARGYIGSVVRSDGACADYVHVPGLGSANVPYVTHGMLNDDQHVIHIRGPELFKSAVKLLRNAIVSVCQQHNVTLDDIDWFIAHQANQRINDGVANALNLDPKKVPSNIARYGNTSAATIGLLADEMRRDGRLNNGDLACFFALGAGLTWGATLMRV